MFNVVAIVVAIVVVTDSVVDTVVKRSSPVTHVTGLHNTNTK